MKDYLEPGIVILSACFGVSLIIVCIIGGTFLFEKGPNFARYWEVDYQNRKIELQLQQKCLKDKYYCNPQNYSFEVKEKSE